MLHFSLPSLFSGSRKMSKYTSSGPKSEQDETNRDILIVIFAFRFPFSTKFANLVLRKRIKILGFFIRKALSITLFWVFLEMNSTDIWDIGRLLNKMNGMILQNYPQIFLKRCFNFSFRSDIWGEVFQWNLPKKNVKPLNKKKTPPKLMLSSHHLFFQG